MALGVMIAAACGDADSDTAAVDETSTSLGPSSVAESDQEEAERAMIEIAREFSAAVDAYDFEGARGFLSDHFTFDCRGEQRRRLESSSQPARQLRDRPASELDDCWPRFGEAGGFTVAHGDDAEYPRVTWSKVRRQGLLVEEFVIEASTSDGQINSLDIVQNVQEADDRDQSLPIAGWGSALEVGQTYRHDLGLHCELDRLEFNGRLFLLDEALEGYTATGRFDPPWHWPIRYGEVEGGELFGLITLVDEDTIELSIPPDEVIAIYGAVDTYEPDTCA